MSNRLNLKILAKNPAVANPLGGEFNYAEAFRTLDLAAVKRHHELEQPLGAVQVGLIYLNPEGPNGNPDPLAR
ncbi:MAG: hypothetical protein ACLP50_02775 [Solirubrobacteraceae bacterium]